jgi:hypothetical protein
MFGDGGGIEPQGTRPAFSYCPVLAQKEQSLRRCKKKREDHVLMYRKISQKTCVGRSAGF